jgi:hypothetical protein
MLMLALADDRRRPKPDSSKNRPRLLMPWSLKMTMSYRRFEDIPRMVINMSRCAVNVGITISTTRKSPQMMRQERSS